jgi:hypothetical protein
LAPRPPLPAPSPSQGNWLPAAEQANVNKAINAGVAWLKESQVADGSWVGPGGARFHHVGMTALPALTLLECGCPAKDEHIQKAARLVREAAPTLNETYEIALCILFLDRLHEADDDLIRTLGLRLVAGQSDAGGWTYICPILAPRDEENMLTILRHQQPGPLGDDIQGARPGDLGTTTNDKPASDKTTQAETGRPDPSRASGSTIPLSPPAQPKKPTDTTMPLTKRPSELDARRARDRLPIHLRNTPGLQPPSRVPAPNRDGSDNSNTQFAILGVWAARRHGLLMENTIARIKRRFHDSQAPDGTWTYQYFVPGVPGTATMTGAGLLGMAVGLGVANQGMQPDKTKPPPRSAEVEKGLEALGRFIGQPLGGGKGRGGNWGSVNLYFLWTVERVGVLYNLRKIDGKDWYAWGVELLLNRQSGDGSWEIGGFPGAVPTVDTSFALLFLKRANLVQDLTNQLEFIIDTRSLQSR